MHQKKLCRSLVRCFEYLRDVWGVLASAANLQAFFKMHRAGFYPKGGGEIQIQIRGLETADNVSALSVPPSNNGARRTSETSI